MPWQESQAPPMPSVRLRLLIQALTALAYYEIGRLGLSFAQTNQSISLIWPPSGFALALTLLLGPWLWPAFLAGAFLANFTTTGLVASSIGIAIRNTLEA